MEKIIKSIFPKCKNCEQNLFTPKFRKNAKDKFNISIGKDGAMLTPEELAKQFNKHGEIRVNNIPICQHCGKPITKIKCAVSGKTFKIKILQQTEEKRHSC